LKSLTAAAKALKLPKSNIRSKIKNLEERELHDLPDAVVSSFMRDARRVSRALAATGAPEVEHQSRVRDRPTAVAWRRETGDVQLPGLGAAADDTQETAFARTTVGR